MIDIDINKVKDLALKAGGDEWEYRKISGEHQVIRKGTLEKCQGYRTFQPVTNELDDIDIAKFIASASPSLVSRLIERLEAAERERDEMRASKDWYEEAAKGLNSRLLKAEAEIARRDAAAGEPAAWKWRLISLDDESQIGPWRLCLAPLTPGKGAGYKTEAIPLYTAVLPPKYADELKDRAELLEAYSKTQCEIAQELGCDSDNESILKAIYDLKALGAQPQKPVVLPAAWSFDNGNALLDLDSVIAAIDAAGVPYEANVKWEVKK